MRKELVLILIVVIGGALVVYNWSGASPLPFHFARGVVRTDRLLEPATEPPGKAAESKPVHKLVPADKPKTAPDRIERPVTAALPQAADPALQPARPFPTAEALKTGAPSKELVATYGEPDFHVAGTSGGRVIEKYYYVSSDRSQLALIIAENGLLTSASFIPGPYFQLPAHGKAQLSQPSKKR